MDQFKEFSEFLEIYESLSEIEIMNWFLIWEIKKKMRKNKTKSLLKKDTDDCNAFVEIHAGAGGTESQDWAEMLSRMYQRFAEKNDYRYKIIDCQRGEEAGIKNLTMVISGFKSFGYLKTNQAFID